jgi:hypothetical protein
VVRNAAIRIPSTSVKVSLRRVALLPCRQWAQLHADGAADRRHRRRNRAVDPANPELVDEEFIARMRRDEVRASAYSRSARTNAAPLRDGG